MKKSIEKYVKNCDSCQCRKGYPEFVAPLGQMEEPVAPFAITAMDITGHICRRRKAVSIFSRLLTIFRNMWKPTPSPITASTGAQVYATQIVTRHGTGSQLITDQGSAFISNLFQETCKLLGIRRTRTTALHPSSNGQVERFQILAHWAFP
jgi:transposase InsO family protein